MTSNMKFALWFNGMVFPVMFLLMGDLATALCLTAILFGVVTGMKWLFIKAFRSASHANRIAAQSRSSRASRVHS